MINLTDPQAKLLFSCSVRLNMKNKQQTDIQKYCANLEKVKWRIASIEDVINSKVSHGKKDLDYEFCAIQIRKILELIMFSTLIAHKEPYSNEFKSFRKHWNVKRLMENLEQINPEFYPIPMVFGHQDPVTKMKHLEELKEKYLLKDEIAELYDYCGGILHTRNPYKTGSNTIDIRLPLSEWVKRIKNLLALHRIKLFNSDASWVVVMESTDDGKVHVLTARSFTN